MPNSNGKHWKLKYIFELKNKKKEFPITIDKESCNRVLPERESFPKWTELDFFKCGTCPLDSEEHSHCPAAISIVEAVEYFGRMVSFTEADITVEMENSSVFKRTSLQVGMSSLIGVCIATSGCPVFSLLKPIALFHAPFASAKKIVFRTLSTYLLAQYFRKLKGKEPDWEMQNLEKFYKDIHSVDKDFAQRLKKIHVHDASINALHILDTFANFVILEVHTHVLEDLEKVMREYVDY